MYKGELVSIIHAVDKTGLDNLNGGPLFTDIHVNVVSLLEGIFKGSTIYFQVIIGITEFCLYVHVHVHVDQ